MSSEWKYEDELDWRENRRPRRRIHPADVALVLVGLWFLILAALAAYLP